MSKSVEKLLDIIGSAMVVVSLLSAIASIVCAMLSNIDTLEYSSRAACDSMAWLLFIAFAALLSVGVFMMNLHDDDYHEIGAC